MGFLPLIVYFLLVLMAIIFVLRMLVWILGMFIEPVQNSSIQRWLTVISDPMIAPFRGLGPEVRGGDWFSFLFAIILLRLMIQFVGTFAHF